MKINFKKFAATVAAVITVFTMAGCSQGEKKEQSAGRSGETVFIPVEPGTEYIPGVTETPEAPEVEIPEERPQVAVAPPEAPDVKTAAYIVANSGGVNIRSGAGTGYSSVGTTENATLYACDGKVGEWYKTYYKNRTAYIAAKYCDTVEMPAGDEDIENIIAEGTKLLGTTYVYGATRYHDGKGKLLSGFTTSEFDCSSLMQYIFKKGAGVNLQVNTRTQIYQGTTVGRSELKRGDLMFFTNASRKNNTGIERVGHVALYLGDNMILHTASDYAKIEKISSLRWSYFIQGQRIL